MFSRTEIQNAIQTVLFNDGEPLTFRQLWDGVEDLTGEDTVQLGTDKRRGTLRGELKHLVKNGVVLHTPDAWHGDTFVAETYEIAGTEDDICPISM